MLVLTTFFGINLIINNSNVEAADAEYGAGEFSYIKNYHFEIDNDGIYGPDNWTKIDNISKFWSTTEYISGSHSYKLQKGTANGLAYYKINTSDSETWAWIDVQPNTNYSIGGWLKVNHSNPLQKVRARVIAKEYNQSEEYQNIFHQLVTYDEFWKYIDCIFQTGKYTTKISLFLYLELPGNGTAWFDDITLKNYTTAPSFLNGDFENNTKQPLNSPDYWTPINNDTNYWDTNETQHGNYSYKLKKIDQYNQMAESVYFNITNNSIYKFGGWVKNNNTNPVIYFREFDEDLEYISQRILTFSSNDWTYKDMAFYTNSNSVFGRIRIRVETDNGKAWFDNISVTQYNLPTPENITDYPPKPDPSDPWQRSVPWTNALDILTHNISTLKDYYENHMETKRISIVETDKYNLWPYYDFWYPYLMEELKNKIKSLRDDGYIIEVAITSPSSFYTSGVHMENAFGNGMYDYTLIDPKVRQYIKNKISMWAPYASTIIFDEWFHLGNWITNQGSFDTYSINGTPNASVNTPEEGFLIYYKNNRTYNMTDVNYTREFIKNNSLTYDDLTNDEKNITKDWYNFRIDTLKYIIQEIKDFMNSKNQNMTLGRDYRGEHTSESLYMGHNKSVYSMYDMLYSNTIYRDEQIYHSYLGQHTRYHYPEQENRLFLGHYYLERNLSSPEGCDYLFTSIATEYSCWQSVGLLGYPTPYELGYYPEGIHERWAPPFKFGAHNIPLLDIPDFENAKVVVWGYSNDNDWFTRNLNKIYLDDLHPSISARKGSHYHYSQFIDYPGTYTNNITNADIVIINPFFFSKDLPNCTQLNGKKVILYYTFVGNITAGKPGYPYNSTAEHHVSSGKKYIGNITGDVNKIDSHYFGVFLRAQNLDDDPRNLRVLNNTDLNNPGVMASYNSTTGILWDGMMIMQSKYIDGRRDDWDYLKADLKATNATIKRDALTNYDDDYTISYSAQTDMNDRLRFMVLDPSHDYYVKYYNVTDSAENISANIDWEGIIADKTTHSEEFINQYTVEIPNQTIVIAQWQEKQNHLDLLNVSIGHVNYAIWNTNFTLEINMTGNGNSNFTVNATSSTEHKIININITTSTSTVQLISSDSNGILNFTENLNGSHIIFVMANARVYNVNQNKWYWNITPAINESNSGDKILAFNYTFYENITMKSNITLEGVGTPIINGNNKTVVKFNNVSNSIIKNFKIIYPYHSFELINSNNNFIVNCQSNYGVYGIFLNGSSNNNSIQNNTLISDLNSIRFENNCNNNSIINNTIIPICYDGYGIYIQNSCNNNTIHNNDISGYDGADCLIGIFLNNGSNNNIISSNNIRISEIGITLNNSCVENNISNNILNSSITYICIFIQESSNNNSILNNNLTNNEDGIYIDSSEYNNISFNYICNNNGRGIYLGGYYSNHTYIYKNNISINHIGIEIEGDSAYNNILNNTFYNNSEYAINILSGWECNIYYNNFYYNNGATTTHDPMHIQASDMSTNYWDDGSLGNFWVDWTNPDDLPIGPPPGDGIVDDPYITDGGSGIDYFPSVNPL
jgi:parallel beta-helix repeat protein